MDKKCHFPTKPLVQSKSWRKQTGSRIQFCFRWDSIQIHCLYFKRVKQDKPDITLISFTFWLNMLPASGGNLSGGCNSAGSSSYDLTSSGILLELNFFKVHFIGWSPSGYWPIGWSMQIYQNTVEMNWSSTQPTGFGIYFL